MLKLKVRDLKEGMTFSASLLTEEGETLLQRGYPVKKEDVLRWRALGHTDVFCRGEVVTEGEGAKSALEKMRETLKTMPDEEPGGQEKKGSQAFATREELNRAKIYESKLYCMEDVEQIVDSISLGLNHFLQNPIESNVLKEKLIFASEKLVKGMRKHSDHFLDVISFTVAGNNFVSHSVRVAVLATYIGISLDQSYKRLIAIAAASLLHDIGKVGYSIVNTYEGIKVSKDKMNLNLTHPVYGYKIAKNFLKLQDEICQAILNHHEQPDGQGFPRRVADIKLFVTDKIVSISNLFTHLIEKNAMNGLATPLNNLQYLLQNFPDKFDHRITQQLNKIRDMDSFALLHDTPAPKETVTDVE